MQKFLKYSGQILAVAALSYGINLWQTRSLLNNQSDAPAFTLQTVDGKEMSLAKLAEKPTVLYFFAPWCTVCDLNIPALDSLDNDVQVFAIALAYQSKDEVTKFISDKEVNVPVLMGTPNIARNYRVNSFPTVYFIDSEKKISNKTVGYTPGLSMRIRAWL